MLHGSVVHDLVRRSGNISVHVIAGDAVAGEPVPKKTVRAAERDDAFDPRPYLAALVAVAVATRLRRIDRPLVRRRERRSGLLDGDRRRRGALRLVAVAAGECCVRRSPTIFSSCRRSTPSRSPIRPMSRPSCLFTWWRSSSPTSPRAGARRPMRRPNAPAPPNRSIRSAASSPAPARSTTCFGRPPIRPR